MTQLRAIRGDLTAQAVDVVVNAANEHLAHGGGLAAAMVRAGGAIVQRESDEWIRNNGPLDRGAAAVTTAGDMAARFVVHVVGPRYSGDPDDEQHLREATIAAVNASMSVNAKTVALPAISSGIFGYPPEEACRVIVAACRDWVAEHPDALEEIRFVGFNEEIAGLFENALGQ